MNFNDKLSSLFWLIISLFVCVQSIRIDIGTFHNPGPGFMPFGAGIVLGMFSITLLIATILKGKEEKRISNLWRGKRWNKVILVLASLFIYAILLDKLGYLISAFCLLALLFGAMKRKGLWVPVVSALITALLSYVIFKVWLGVQLPEGILGL